MAGAAGMNTKSNIAIWAAWLLICWAVLFYPEIRAWRMRRQVYLITKNARPGRWSVETEDGFMSVTMDRGSALAVEKLTGGSMFYVDSKGRRWTEWAWAMTVAQATTQEDEE